MKSYYDLKRELANYAIYVKKHYPKDYPAQRMHINDYADMLCKENNLNEKVSDMLHRYAGKLHPKN